jgi:hypothetical protein
VYQKGLRVPEKKTFVNPPSYLSWCGTHRIVPKGEDSPRVFDARDWELEIVLTKKSDIKVGSQITTEEELLDVPTEAILRDNQEDAWQRSGDNWLLVGSDERYSASEALRYAPLTVLHINSGEVN